MIPIGTSAAMVSIILWIISGTILKKVSSGLGSHFSSFVYLAVSLIPIVLATIILGVYSIPLFGVITALAGGVFLGVGLIYAFKALQTENLVNVSALAEIQPAILVLFGLLVLGEQVTTIQLVGMVVIFAGALMIITTEKLRINKMLLPALYSAVLWTVYWIILSYSVISANTFALPILISRIVGVPIVFCYLFTNKHALMKLHGFWDRIKRNRAFMVLISLTVIASIADASGDTLFGITIGSPVLAIGAALVALQPMVVSFLGFILYRDKLTKLQLYGLVVMIAGALVLSVL